MSMMMKIRPARACVVLAIVLTVGLAHPARAQTATGAGVLTSKVKLAAKGCGRFKGKGLLTVALVSDETWMATDDEGLVFGGTYVPGDATGRVFDLDLDAASLVLLGATLAGNLSGLCQAAVEVTAMEKKRFRFALNRRSTTAKLKLEYRLTGTANGQPGTAILKLSATGPWVAMP
jgi:hypothetical protein